MKTPQETHVSFDVDDVLNNLKKVEKLIFYQVGKPIVETEHIAHIEFINDTTVNILSSPFS